MRVHCLALRGGATMLAANHLRRAYLTGDVEIIVIDQDDRHV